MKRDLTTLALQIQAFPGEELLWQTVPGITNPAGNLVLHLEGNLREYIGRHLGNVAYERDRPKEFTAKALDKAELLRRVEYLSDVIPSVVSALSPAQLMTPYPHVVLERELSVEGFLVHLFGHLNWHMGQIDYIRRVLSEDGAVKRATL
ncbi:MAG TPA: DinB family protein [Thermoanaerobaculia bacterium]